MALKFALHYHQLVLREDIPRLPPAWREKIKHAIEDRLTEHPEVYGKPLRRSLKGYRKLRVGDYRVIFRIEGVTVKIIMIKHRAIVYSLMERRV